MFKKILKYITIAAIACYLVFAFVIIPLQKDDNSCKGIEISICNNKLGTINTDEISELLRSEGLYPQGKPMDSVRCSDIEGYIKTISLVKECQVYKTNDKSVKVDVICREPVLKVFDKCGTTYYVDIDGRRIDNINKPLLLPVASGDIDDSMIANELQSIVKAIEKEPFWLAQIEQIYFNEKKEIIVTPRVGDHIIELGSVKQLDEKLKNLKEFYANGLNTVGWNKYSKLNIKISNKVICTKRD